MSARPGALPASGIVLDVRVVVAPCHSAGGRARDEDAEGGGSDAIRGAGLAPVRDVRARARAEPLVRLLLAHSWARLKD